NAIVDWVWIGLRPKNDTSLIAHQQAALVQRDGDVVASDGVSPLFFWAEEGEYFVSIHHRNHLGSMAAAPIEMSKNVQSIDFRTVSTYGTHAQKQLSNGQYALWAGDANGDGQIIFQGGGSETTEIFVKILTAPANGSFSRSFVLSAYELADANLSGDVVFQGGAADVSLVFINVLTHPDNTTFSRSFVITAKLP
ncbi:MAG: hemagglutinin protein, partial [Bacteroidota bacterium]